MSRPAAVLIGGPPATGKSTLAAALAPRLGAALLDLDVATGPLTRVVSDLIGVHDPDDPALARLTRAARYDTLLGLAEANLQAGLPWSLSRPLVPNELSLPPGPPSRVGSRASPRWSGCTCHPTSSSSA